RYAGDGRSTFGMEGPDRLQSPRLAFFAFGFRPGDRLPVRRKDQPCAGAGYLDSVPTRLVYVEKKCLLDRVLVRSRLDIDAILEKYVGSAQHILACVQGKRHVMQAPVGARIVARISEVIALVRRGHPHAGFSAVVEHDLLRKHEAEIFLKEFAVGLDIHGQSIEVIDATNVDATGGKFLCLVLEGGL